MHHAPRTRAATLAGACAPLPLAAQTAAPGAAAPLGWSSIVGTLLALLFVLALAWAALHLLKRLQGRPLPGAGGDLQVLRTLNLGPRERLVLVRHGDAELLLGVTAAAVTLLHRQAGATEAAGAPAAAAEAAPGAPRIDPH